MQKQVKLLTNRFAYYLVEIIIYKGIVKHIILIGSKSIRIIIKVFYIVSIFLVVQKFQSILREMATHEFKCDFSVIPYATTTITCHSTGCCNNNPQSPSLRLGSTTHYEYLK